MSPLSDLERVRQQKLERLRELGIEPYPRQVVRTHTNAAAIEAFEVREAAEDETPVEVAVAGRLRSVRAMGKVTFAHIEDG
ncbi:MAG: lysine--tRNA ligase, partial [Anaerolineales bacterium]